MDRPVGISLRAVGRRMLVFHFSQWHPEAAAPVIDRLIAEGYDEHMRRVHVSDLHFIMNEPTPEFVAKTQLRQELRHLRELMRDHEALTNAPGTDTTPHP